MDDLKGIILAGGLGKRLGPLTKITNKHLLPVYNKPMIYYPLSVLMLAGIRDILVISMPQDIPRFNSLLGDGSGIGIDIKYAVQHEPKGIADALIIGEGFSKNDTVSLILGDNIFYGHDMTEHLREAASLKKGAMVFGYYVNDPGRYGVIDFDKNCKVVSIEEKPKKPRSNWVVTGLYFYDRHAVNIAKKIRPSWRGELEITDVNREYLKKGQLKVKMLGRGFAWLDTGTHDALIDASMFIKTVEDRQGLKIGCIEEIAYRMGYIDKRQLLVLSRDIKTSYGDYLRKVCENE